MNSEIESNHGPLEGIRVIDASTTVLGPYATHLLAQMGASVIKVEAPPKGDVTRWISKGRHAGMGSVFVNINHGKRSIAVDLKSPDGKAVMNDLLESADVFVHNIRRESVEHLGLGPERLSKDFPKLVHCIIEGFGEGGPYSGQPAYDDVIQAMTGVAHLEGIASGEPSYVQSIVVDKVCALVVVTAIMGALFTRQATGRGGAVAVPMFESMASFVLVEHMAGRTFLPPVDGPNYPRTVSPYRRPYRTLDGYISVLVYTDAQWERFLKMVGRADLWESGAFSDASKRSENIDNTYKTLEEIIETDTTASWMSRLEEADIPRGPVNTIDDLLADPHIDKVGLLTEVEHPSEGLIRVLTPAIRFDGQRRSAPLPLAPVYGQDTRAVLAELGYDDSDVARLANAAVFGG